MTTQDILNEFDKKINSLNDVDRLQIKDVYSYLKKCQYVRGQTFKEIVLSFDGVLSREAVIRQLARLVKWKEIKIQKVTLGNRRINFFLIK